MTSGRDPVLAAGGTARSGHTLERLVYMANQIAREFGNQRPRDSVEATWDHLWHFWDPRMRSMIVAHLREGGEGLSDNAKAAVNGVGRNGNPNGTSGSNT